MRRISLALVLGVLVLSCGTRFPARAPDPVIGRVHPARGPASGGTILIVEGLAFQPGARVFFGAQEAVRTTFVSGQLLTAQTPAGEAGAAPEVSVINPDGLRTSLDKGFAYQAPADTPAPEIVNVSPNAGPAAGGTVAELRGANFEEGLLVFVGGVPAVEPVMVSAELATATFPPSEPGARDVAITNLDGRTAVMPASFAYNPSYTAPPPLITGVLPQGGPVAGGVKGEITGSDFARGAKVYIGGRPAPTVFQADTLLEITLPPGKVGLSSVAVTNPDGQGDRRPAMFSYYRPGPVLTLLAPEAGNIAGGTTVILIGANFDEDTVVRFGQNPASVQFDDDRTLRVSTPPGATWGPADVVVKNRDGQEDVRSGAFYYFDADHPPPGTTSGVLKVDRVLPAAGPTTGGTPVMIVGGGFLPGTRVAFGADQAQDVIQLSGTTLSMRAPSVAQPGPVDVTVTLPGGRSQRIKLAFIYYDTGSPLLAPVIAGINPSTGPAVGGTMGLLTGRNFEPGADLYFADTPAARVTVLDSNRISFVTPAGADGLADVTVINPDGRSGRLALGFAYYIGEGVSPQVTGVDPPSSPAGREVSVTVNGGELQAGALLFLGDVPGSLVQVSNAAQLSALLPVLAPGAYDVAVTNPDGRTGRKDAGFSYTTPTPYVTRVVPSIGSTAGGARALIQGSAFLDGAKVFFADNEVTDVLFVESGALLVTTPPGVAGVVDVTVENPGGGSGKLLNAFEYKDGYVSQPPPSLASTLPPTGPSSGGTVLLLRGAGLQAGMTVLFGAAAARKVLVGRPTEAVIVAPAGNIGPVDITVINPDGQVAGLAAGFRYTDPGSLPPPPILTGVIPNAGPQTVATDLLLTGRRFTQGALVFVGAFLSPFARRDSDTLISSRAPAGQVGAVDVAVTSVEGQSSVLENAFSYRAAPVVTSVDPAEAPDAGGRQIQIFGEHFEAGSKVFFGGTPAGVTFIGQTLLVAITPQRAAGVVDVVVENADRQQGTLSGGFTFRAPPYVGQVMPAAGPVTGGTIAAVLGDNFLPGAQVWFDGTLVETGYGDTRTLAIRVPAGAFIGQARTVIVVNPDAQSDEVGRGFVYTDPALLVGSPPTLTSVAPVRGPESGGTYALLRGTNFANLAIVFFGNRLMTQTKSAFGTALTGVVPAGPRGPARVAVTNPDGRSVLLVPGFTFEDASSSGPAPVVSSANPAAGVTRGGETISVGGSGFSGTPLVFLAGFPAQSVTPVANTTLTVVTGRGAVGNGDVVVTNPDGRSGARGNGWTYEATAPSFESSDPIAPAAGPSRGGTTVTLRGFDFEFGAEVRFGTALASSVNFVSPSELRVRTPPGPIGKVSVTVVNPGGKNGTLTDGYEYVPPPLVLTVSPASGPTAGGNAVVINGRFFRPGAQVKFGNVDAVTETVETDTVITTIAPPGTGTVAVKIINGDADSQPGEMPNGYVYLASIQPPKIVAISPDNGEANGGTYITVVGEGFIAGAKVTFGTAQADQVTVMSGGALTCRTPGGTENTRVRVTVQNPPFPGGTEASTDGAFLYRQGRSLGTLALAYISPQQGPCAGGTEVVVGGEGFQTGAQLYFNGVLQNEITVFGPTAISAKTQPYGDPSTCPATPVTVRVQNPSLEIAELTGAQRFSYVGGNRRFAFSEGDRLPQESWNDKSYASYTSCNTSPSGNPYYCGSNPVIARLTGTTGGGNSLADILIGRRAVNQTNTSLWGDYLYYQPRFDLVKGVLWSDNFSSLRRYDPACAAGSRILNPIDRVCTTGIFNTHNLMWNPIVADFDKNLWDDVLYYEKLSDSLVILYNDGGILTRYTLVAGFAPVAPACAQAPNSQCGSGNYVDHAVANLDLDSAGKLDIVVATDGIDFILQNDTSPTESGRYINQTTAAGWHVMAPRTAGGVNSKMRYQGGVSPTGDNSRGVAAGDIDGDGDVDIMVAGYDIPVKTYLSNWSQVSDKSTFFWQDAGGAPFGSSTAWTGRMRGINLRDYDNDGDLDLIITHQSAQDEIWLNDSLGRFTSATLSSACGTGRRLPLVTNRGVYKTLDIDLDVDGDLDLVQWLEAGTNPPRPIRIYKNNRETLTPARAGCFVEATAEFFPTAGELEVADLTRDIGFGDLDGDGYPDAVYAGDDYKQSRVYFNVPEGGRRVFRDRTRLRLPNRWDKYTFGAGFVDVDGDGDSDLLLSTTDSIAPNGSVSNYFYNYYCGYHACEDSRLRLYLNDGSAHFTDATTQLPSGPVMASRIVSGDVDGDGDPDLLLPNFVEPAGTPVRHGDYKLYINDGTGRFKDESYPRLPTGEPSNRLYGRAAQLVDFDADSDLDIIAGTGNSCLRFWMNTGGGYFTDITSTAVPVWSTLSSCQNYSYGNGAVFVRDILVSDFDFNGTLDLFVSREAGNLLMLNCPDANGMPRYYYATGTAPCAPPSAPTIPAGGSYGASMYKRNDGGTIVTDVILYMDNTSRARLWRGSRVSPGRLADETAAYLTPSPLAPLNVAPDYYSIGVLFAPFDYDNDGDLDFIHVADHGANSLTTTVPARVLRNAGVFTDTVREPSAFNPFSFYAFDDPRGSVAADLNDDGYQDLFIMNVWNPRILLSAP